MVDFKKEITFRPAYDERDPDPKKDYGINGVMILFVLSGPKGAVQFLCGTEWYPAHLYKENPIYTRGILADLHNDDKPPLRWPNGWDLGYHSPVPMYEGHEPMNGDCPYVEGGRCYYDGSGLMAEPIVAILVNEGSDGVWKRLEEYYHEVFDEENQTVSA